MISRERVLRAFTHQETDRVPIDYGGTIVTSIDYHADQKLQKYLGIRMDNSIIDYSMGTVEPCEQIKSLFGSDFRRVGMNVIAPEFDGDHYTDGFGIILRKARGHAYYDVVSHPLANAATSDIARMRLPNPDNPELYTGLRERAQKLYEETDYAIVADFGVPGFYETSQKLRGYDNLACDLLMDTGFISALFDCLMELQMRFFDNYLGHVGKYVNVICYADDLGMQDRLQMSPDTYRRVIKPYHKTIFDYIHQRTTAKLMIHSCGAIESIIGDLIEIGVDIINPLQTNATGMKPEMLKRKYGKSVVFWGGIDEQKLLPHSTPDQIKTTVRQMIETMAQGGGYVFAPSHNIQSDVPSENVTAMYEAALEGTLHT